MQARLTRIDSEHASLCGDLNNATVVCLLKEGERLLASAQDYWHVDMAEVSQVSSVGVSLLLRWQAIAQQRDLRLQIANLPSRMRPILEISDLTELIEPLLVEC